MDDDPDRVLARFEQWGARLSSDALRQALRGAGADAAELDFLAAATCTGYLCPGLSAYIADACGLRTDIRRVDVVGMGCGAALPALERARDFVLAHPRSLAAVVCTEICSAAFFSSDEPDIVISNTIFADGSAAVLLSGGERGGDGAARLADFHSRLHPEWRDTLRFRTKDGRLKNVLEKETPDRAAAALRTTADELLARHGLATRDVAHWIVHPGGAAVLDKVEERLDLFAGALASSRAVLKRCGNMSSPSVLFVLEEELRARPPQPGTLGVLASFGAGFAAHAALIEF